MSGALLGLTGSSISSGFSATLTDTSVHGSSRYVGTVQTIDSTTCTPVNGTAPYSYAWSYVSGDTEIYANLPTSATTRFSAYFPSSDIYTAVWKCTVTDSAANVVDSNTVSITLSLATLD